MIVHSPTVIFRVLCVITVAWRMPSPSWPGWTVKARPNRPSGSKTVKTGAVRFTQRRTHVPVRRRGPLRHLTGRSCGRGGPTGCPVRPVVLGLGPTGANRCARQRSDSHHHLRDHATLDVPGATPHYQVRGTGPTMLMICGGIYDVYVLARCIRRRRPRRGRRPGWEPLHRRSSRRWRRPPPNSS